jgi:hypothetical protein
MTEKFLYSSPLITVCFYLIDASKSGDFEMVDCLIEKGKTINYFLFDMLTIVKNCKKYF